MDRDVQSKADQVKELALRGKDLQDFCKGKCWFVFLNKQIWETCFFFCIHLQVIATYSC